MCLVTLVIAGLPFIRLNLGVSLLFSIEKR